MKRTFEAGPLARRLRAPKLADTAGLLAFVHALPVQAASARLLELPELSGGAAPDFATLVHLALAADPQPARLEARRLGDALRDTTAPAALQRLELLVAALPAPAALWLHEEGVFHFGRWLEMVRPPQY